MTHPTSEQLVEIYEFSRSEASEFNGTAYIYNFENFSPCQHELPDRHGSSNDVALLFKLFTKMGLNTTVHLNLNHSDMRRSIKNIIKKEKTCDVFICVVMSHGKESTKFHTSDGKLLCLQNDVMAQFETSPHISNIVKIYIANFCRVVQAHNPAAPSQPILKSKSTPLFECDTRKIVTDLHSMSSNRFSLPNHDKNPAMHSPPRSPTTVNVSSPGGPTNSDERKSLQFEGERKSNEMPIVHRESRGSMRDSNEGFEAGHYMDGMTLNPLDTDSPMMVNEVDPGQNTEGMKNTLVIHSTQPDRRSLRNTKSGSFFIQHFVAILDCRYTYDGMLSMTNSINKHMEQKVKQTLHVEQFGITAKIV